MHRRQSTNTTLSGLSTILSLLGFCFFLTSCAEKDKSIDVYSYTIKNKKEKLRILKDYLSKDAGLLDAEYHIWYQDNSGGMVPGPSDYSITVALKINPDSLSDWATGLKFCSPKSPINFWDKLKLDKRIWHVTSTPEYYTSETKDHIKILYRKEAIIFVVYATNPVAIEGCSESNH